MLLDLRTLAADSFAGRQVGTPGGTLARAYVASRMATTGARALTDSLVIPFAFRRGRDSTAPPLDAGNIVAVVRGTRDPARYIVLSAHFDHVGIGRAVNGDSIYNGADDNASGTAAVLELARWFAAHPPQHSIIFAAFDAEESGLRGARAFVADPPVPRDSIIVNVNLDMVSRNDRDELFAVGTFDNPVLRPYVERAQQRARVTLRVGHEGPSATGSDNWTAASDHGAFRAQQIPYLYFGVEDHSGYHHPSDEADAITPGFYARAVETVLDVILDIDHDAGPIAAARR
jgi:Zn-dependent M28 family amino/carboxypeptidase